MDDHSPDGVPDLGCDCVKVIQPPKHEPHIWRLNTVRNYGLKNAEHDWCIILDSDCIPNPRFIDNARKRIDSSVLFTGRIDRVQEDGSILCDNRDNSGKAYWGDLRDKRGSPIWGGVMAFSKSRTSLVDWFSEDYNGSWGYGELDFASKCYHSGIRLRYSPALQVTHQHHPKYREGYQRNRKLWLERTAAYKNHLSTFSSYKPAVAVLIVTMMRPYYIDQVMRAVFRSLMPLKVILVNNGDNSEHQRNALSVWNKRWTVDYINHPSRALLADIRTETMRRCKREGYTYLMMIDDDITPMTGSIVSLVSEMELNKEYHALSGYIKDKKRTRFIGGKIKNNKHYYYLPVREQTIPADYISSGFTLVRLDKVVPYPEGWEMGWNDWCWSHEVKKRGLKLGVTGKAGAYHHLLFTPKGQTWKQDSGEYRRIRYDRTRHNQMAEKYRDLWGYTPTPARPITEMNK